MRALVVSVSNRAAAGVYSDTTGPLIASRLADWGFDVSGPEVVPDGAPVGAALRSAVEASYDVVLTTGGTGISPTDETPETDSRCADERSCRASLKPSGLTAWPTAYQRLRCRVDWPDWPVRRSSSTCLVRGAE